MKIVITGGPSGGKTTLIEALRKDFHGELAVVPEAASILYRGGFPRKVTLRGRMHAQRAICFVQTELENLVADESEVELIVCDRGSLDSVAYWPDTAENFFRDMQTSREKELARYAWVIHLDTADHDAFDTSNPVRTESFSEALELNQKIKKAWEGHPNRIVIGHNNDFLTKISEAKNVIGWIRQGLDRTEIETRRRSQKN